MSLPITPLLTHKQLEMYECIFSTVATAALVLKHQATNSHSADKELIVLDQIHAEILHLWAMTLGNKIVFCKKKYPVV